MKDKSRHRPTPKCWPRRTPPAPAGRADQLLEQEPVAGRCPKGVARAIKGD
jgi:hypothetical protein